MSMEIIIENLVKYYGKQRALDGVSLTIPGGMFGLLGANGSGKTTLMRILATLIPKDGGTVTMDGISLERIEEIRRMVGYLPQDFNMYPYYTVSQALDYIAYLSGIRKGRMSITHPMQRNMRITTLAVFKGREPGSHAL